MNTEFFIAKRLALFKTDSKDLSRLMVKIATVSIALGMVVMMLAIGVVTGFRQQIESKIVGYGSHLQITNFDSNISYESTPISNRQDFLEELRAMDGVAHVQQFATKGGIISTSTDNQGALLRGVSTDFDWSFFSGSLIQGEIPSYTDTVTSNSILISDRLCRMLQLKLGDKVDMYFVQDPPRARKFTIVGIFDTQLQEVDESLVICDIRHIQRLCGWSADEISGFEVKLTDIGRLDELEEKVDDLVSYKVYEDGSRLKVTSIKDLFAHLFSWLDILDTNVWVILSLTLLVAGFNMVSGLLIMLLEKTAMIGILKSLGMRNIQLQRLFIYRFAFIVVKGMLIGNIVGIGLTLIQQHTKLLKLDPQSYFVSFVPINLSPLAIILLNLGVFAVIVVTLVLPSMIILKISPEKSIKQD